MHDAPTAENFLHRIERGELSRPPCSETLGTRAVRFDPQAMTAEVDFDAPATLLNPLGTIQGGFLSAMLDDAMSIAIVASLPPGEGAPTLSMNTLYHAPARPGALTARGRVTMRGRRICHLAGELMQDGTIVASATATAAIRTVMRSEAVK